MNRIPGISKYRAWLNKQAGPDFFVNEILELGAFWTETILSNEKTGEQFWARIYHIESHQEESLRGLWQDFSFALQGINEDLLQHPQGLKKVGSFQAYLSTYERGVDLKSYLKRVSHLKPNRAIPLILQIIKSLETVYARGAAHFQLKPCNLILSPEGNIIVKNFGLYEMENLLGKQVGAQHFWDVAYFSPEHFGDQELTIASDIYSLGLILFEMVTGKQPFSGQYQDVMTAHMKSMPPNPQALNPEINLGLARVLQRMLAKRKNQRFQSFTELREALFLLLTPLEQIMFRQFTHVSDSQLDETETEQLDTDFAKVKQLKIQGKAAEALSQLELVIRMHGLREEFGDIALELADLISHDKLESMIFKAEDYLQNGHPYKAMRITEEILSIHPFHAGAKSVFRKCQNLMDISPLNALQPAIATDILLKESKNLSDERALFALSRVILSDPENEQALADIKALCGERDPSEKKLEQIRLQRDRGEFTQALALIDSFLGEYPENRRVLMLKKQITEQVHIMSSGKISDAGETIPIGIDGDIDDDFSIDPEEQHLVEEGVLNVQIAIQNKQYDSAEKDLQELRKQFPDDPALNELHERLSAAQKLDFIQQTESRLRQLVQVGDDKGASLLVRDILREDPTHGFAKAVLEKLEKKRNALPASETLFREVKEMEQSGNIIGALEKIQVGLAKVPRTRELLDLEKHLSSLNHQENELDWWLNEAKTMISNGNHQAAQEKIGQILKKFPNNPAALALLETIKKPQTQAPGPPPPMPPSPQSLAPVPPPVSEPSAQVLPPYEPPSQEAQQPEKKKKINLLIPIAAAAIVIIACCGGGYWFYQKKQKEKAWLALFQEASQIEVDGDLPAALAKWKELVDVAPEFQDSLGHMRDLEKQIQDREEKISSTLEKARNYKDDGYYFDDSEQNAIVMLRQVFELDADNQEAKQMYNQILDLEMESAQVLFDEDRILEARDKYAFIQEIDPKFKDEVFEGQISQWLEDTIVLPAMDDINKAIKRKKWDQAIELSDQLREKTDPVVLLDEAWNKVFTDLESTLPNETNKSKILKTLELMVKIQPDNEALIMEKNELNRELNQAKIDGLVAKMEKAYQSKKLITTGRRAKELLALDSEHELAKERLFDAIGKLKSKAEREARNHPSKAISTYQSLLQIENMKTYRKAIGQLQNRLSRFNKAVDKVHQSTNKHYEDFHNAVIRAVENSAGFENEKEYTFIQTLKTGMEAEKVKLDELLTWESGVREDSTKTYQSIVEHLAKATGFKYAFSKQELARLNAYYEDRIENYAGDLTLVIIRASNLPKVKSFTSKDPDAFAVIQIGSSSCKTEPVKDINPVWNHICQFTVQKGESITLTVNSRGRIKKSTQLGAISIASIPLSGKNQKYTSSKGWSVVMDIRRAR